MAIENVQPSPVCISEASTTTLEGGPTFSSQIPFHYVYACIFEKGTIYSETNPVVEAGHNFQLDLSLTGETKEYHVFVYQITSNNKEMVGAMRGNVSDLNQQGTIALHQLS